MKSVARFDFFTDDIALYITIKCEEDSSTLQKDLDTLSVWKSKWNVKFNPSKCQVVQVTGPKNPLKSEYIPTDRFWRLSPVSDILGLIFQIISHVTLTLVVLLETQTGP